MKIYTLENIKRLKENDNLYDIFYPMLKDYSNSKLGGYIVREEREMRIDLICMDIYGNDNYVDELMQVNGLVDPYSVKKDDIIFFIDRESMNFMRKNYEGDKQELEKELDRNRDKSGEYSTSNNFVSVFVDKNKKEISIK